ncbi:MAG TPA: ATP-dependent sacrificial sulfur transferase LarE [Bacteroidales bacterium]|jgi:pyridinium-3,5-biscarboxylic acid mononucleotide sulfurtransferase|nr:ATP-dependent sacrificial sulfur transferase LarE [Bacteroidales bacterium]HBZ20056.1 ATP-dependent sacrificial sulfur transferase LarE [Bacteroidales bacterium]
MIKDKTKKLDSILKELKSFIVAFSGGVDSSFLLYRAHSLKGLEMMGVTIKTPYIPDAELEEALEFAKMYGINHRIINLSFPESVRNNPDDRCYICKKNLFGELMAFAGENGFRYIIDGTNADDTNVYRPGVRALRELGIRSPLHEAGLTKNEIRELLRKESLSIADKPAMACLLTRIPYNTTVTEGMLKMIEQAESFLFSKGFPGARVRIHGDLARIECLPGYFERLIQNHDKEHIISTFKKIGFRYVSLDLEGYRSGSADQ